MTSGNLRELAEEGYDLSWGHLQSKMYEAADEIDRLTRRNAELSSSESDIAGRLRVAESHRKMVCGLNKQLSDERDAAKEQLVGLQRDFNSLSHTSAEYALRITELKSCLQSLVGETMPTADDFNAARAALEEQ
jgi:chromosome segregation ATPase